MGFEFFFLLSLPRSLFTLSLSLSLLSSEAGCTPGELRLVNGSTPAEGRIEMCLDDVWGTLCGIIWIEIDSIVACRQLGYNDYGETLKFYINWYTVYRTYTVLVAN